MPRFVRKAETVPRRRKCPRLPVSAQPSGIYLMKKPFRLVLRCTEFCNLFFLKSIYCTSLAWHGLYLSTIYSAG